MTTLNDKLEKLASISGAREVYNQYLYMIVNHIEVIEIVKEFTKEKKPLKLLAETYGTASIASFGDRKDQIMYDILREIAYYTAINQESPIHSPEGLVFCVDNAKQLIEGIYKKNKDILAVTDKF